MDGSSFGNPGPAGFGGFVRDPDGNFLFGIIGHIGLSEILQVELIGFRDT